MKDDIFHLVRLAFKLGRVERGVNHPDGRPEDDNDHSISLAWLACSLAQELYPELDLGLIAQLAVVHDAVEIYAGDTYAVTAGDDGRQAKKERESQAQDRICRELKELPWLPEMIKEYEYQDCMEARFVRLVDKLMPKIALRLEGRAAEVLREKGVTVQDIRNLRAHEDALFAEDPQFRELDRLRRELHAQLELNDLENTT